MSIVDQAIHAIGIDRDYWKERAEQAEQALTDLSRQFDEAIQVAVAVAAERRGA